MSNANNPSTELGIRRRHAWVGVTLLYGVFVFVALSVWRPFALSLKALALIWIPFLAVNTIWWYFGYPPRHAPIPSPQPINPDNQEPTAPERFLLQEHKILADEIAAQLSELWGFEKFALGGAAAIAAWLATHEIWFDQAWWLPFVFLCLCAIRFAAGMVHIVWRLSAYVQTIETRFLGDSGGYEKWFRKQFLVQTIAHFTVWIVAILLALFAAFLGPLSIARAEGTTQGSVFPAAEPKASTGQHRFAALPVRPIALAVSATRRFEL